MEEGRRGKIAGRRVAAAIEAELADELLVEAELLRQWQLSDGAFLAEKGFSNEVQASARAAFLADSNLRGEVERRIRIHQGLGERIEREQLQVAPDCAEDLLQQVAESMGLEMTHLKKALTEDEAAAREVASTALYLTAVRRSVAEACFEVID